MGLQRDWGGGQFWDPDVVVGGDAGASSLHVRDRTFQRGPCVVR